MLQPHQAHPGTIVRVREDFSGPDCAGMRGVIVRSFGSPSHAALDVRLENGRLELFWLHQLECGQEIARA